MNLFSLFRPKSKVFTELLKEYFSSLKGISDSTRQKHSYYYANIVRFLNSSSLSQIQIHEIKIRHMEFMRSWLLDNIKSCKRNRKCTLEHASRHIEHCQAAFDYAVMMEYYTYNPIDVIKCQRDKVNEPQSLESPEIMKLLNANFTSKLWTMTADYILFLCFTGLNYMDLWIFNIEEDTIIVDGKPQIIEWVTSQIGRGKNNKPYSTQFHPEAKRIYKKYNGQFPIITNQAMNRVLKKIAFSLNIDKELSTSIGRKTYSTLRFDQGMSFDAISDELGNTPEILKKHYRTRSKARLKNEISKLKGPLFPNDGKEFASYKMN